MTALETRQSEVTQTRAPIGANQDVLGLDVSVDEGFFSVVEVVKGGADVVKPIEAACPGEEGEFFVVFQDFVKAASGGQLHHNTRG